MSKSHLIHQCLSTLPKLRDVFLCAVVIVAAMHMGACSEDTEEKLFGTSRLVPEAKVDATLHTAEGTDASATLLPFIPAADELSLTLVSADGRYRHIWERLSEYPADEPLLSGIYQAEVSYGSEYDEGIDSPYFYGYTTVDLSEAGVTKKVEITAYLANTLWQMSYTDALTSYFKSAKAIFHSDGGGYIEVLPGQQKPVFLRAGSVRVMMQLEMPSGKTVEFLAATIADARPAKLYNVVADLTTDGGEPTVVLSVNESTTTDDVSITLSSEFLESEAPLLECEGFVSGAAITVGEGTTTPHPVIFKVNPQFSEHLLLTMQSAALTAAGWPSEIDLATASEPQLRALRNLGLAISETDGIRSYDFSRVIPNLRADGTKPSTNTISLTATSASGRMSGPAEIHIDVTPVDISIVSVSPVVMGINQALMQVITSDANLTDNLVIETRESVAAPWSRATLTSVTQDAASPGRWYVNFSVPEGATATVEMRILYCGQLKAQTVLQRLTPNYTLKTDCYAMLAIVSIDAGTPEMTAAITSTVNIYIDGNPTLLISRRPQLGYIIVGGLEANRTYQLTTTMYDRISAASHPEGFTPAVTLVTENDAPVPNGDFEEIRSDEIKYSNLPSGGRYSQNIVDIFNRQNYCNYNLSVPKIWANTNAKTFCMAARRHNTWYMVPSGFTTTQTASGAYAAVIRSTGWDLNGEAIPDYRQTSQPYTEYSQNIPHIAHRAAGKLYLGNYSFDPSTLTEKYQEGVEFHSRPSALNGYYRFSPSLGDFSERGMVRVEVLGTDNGMDIVIARGEYLFDAAVSYKAFSVPLTYDRFGIKATRLKILFASSSRTGGIAEESATVSTYSDPTDAMSIGNELWIDNLTFTY